MPHHLTGVARALRRDLTPAERVLWQAIRKGGLYGAKARRQMPFGRYVLDFAFVSAKVAVEVDGETHADRLQRDRDLARDSLLRGWGWRVLRFTNREVLGNLDGVLVTITAALEAPHPGPLPKGEGAGCLPLPWGEGRGEGLASP